MNRIVREHYPVAHLPDDLRAEIGAADVVRLVIEAEVQPTVRSRRQALDELAILRKGLSPSADDAVERVSRLWDEWDRSYG